MYFMGVSCIANDFNVLRVEKLGMSGFAGLLPGGGDNGGVASRSDALIEAATGQGAVLVAEHKVGFLPRVSTFS
ncbi:MAG: hypothetical protein IKT16_09185 [Desulfovibrio sp.]|nr:hypothetical protein [Desulfovibrio sp.]